MKSLSLKRRFAVLLVAILALVDARIVRSQEGSDPAGSGAAAAEDSGAAEPATPEVETEIPLLERTPFDIIVLDEENRNFEAEVEPIESLPRPSVPDSAKRGWLKFRFLDDITQVYEADWNHIVEVKFFETMLFEEARRLVAEGEFDEAYRYFLRLTKDYPDYPGLTPAINSFLFLDAGQLYKNGRFAESLSVMEVLYARDPNHRRPGLLKSAMGKLVNQIVKDYVDKKEFRSARIVLDRLAQKYGNEKPDTIKYWRDQLTQLAKNKLQEAKGLFDEKRYREAIALTQQSLDIAPTLSEARALDLTLAETYPQIKVGVTQPALTYDSGRLDNWSARRTGRLVHRTLIEFLGAGSEGGEYRFPGGAIERSPDGRVMTFRLNQFGDDPNTPIKSGYDLTRRLLELSDPRSVEYRAGWGGLMTGISVDDVLKVDVELRRSHVLPESLLRVPMKGSLQADGSQTLEGTGSFRVDVQGEAETRFVDKSFTPGSRLAELVEIRFDDANAALNALRRSDIDIIDRLFPSDAARLKDKLDDDSDLLVQQYALPTVHMLIPKSDHPFLANRNFRRALVFGIDRQKILQGDLLGGTELPGCTVISGPFPAGVGSTDPLGYAYDHRIETRVWRPRLARLLSIVAGNELTMKAEMLDEEPPKLTPLLLAHPATEAARVASQAIKAYLGVIGIEVNVKELPPGASTDPENECDLLYTEIAIWEPVADARRLLGPNGAAASDSPYINQALRRLDEAENWGQVRDQLVALHAAAHNEVTVIPLWQTTDFFVYNKRVRNIGAQPVWMYQNVDQWRLSTQTAQR